VIHAFLPNKAVDPALLINLTPLTHHLWRKRNAGRSLDKLDFALHHARTIIVTNGREIR
jgi:hypothetical protein